MIDCHAHLEQKEYDGKLEFLVPKWKTQLKMVISSCAHPQDLEKTLQIYQKFRPFVKICFGLHPTLVKELKEEDIKKVIRFSQKYKKEIVAIGEIGLDYHYFKDEDEELKEKQKEIFIRFIKFAKELNLPVVVHCRKAEEDTIKILEQQGMKDKKVLIHLLQEKKVVPKVIENNWFVSIGPGILKSKDIKKIARDMPLKKILLETDSPWFAQPNQEFGTPENVKIVCEKIAEIKKISSEAIEKQTDENAIEFFNL